MQFKRPEKTLRLWHAANRWNGDDRIMLLFELDEDVMFPYSDAIRLSLSCLILI